MMNKYHSVVFLLLASFLLGGCFVKKTPQSVQYADEEAIPYKIAVLPAEYVDHSANSTEHKSVLVLDDDRVFVADITRASISNQLAGKGFMPLQKDVVDNTLAELGQDDGWRSMSDAELCKLLNADGIVKTDIYSADMIKALAFDLFQLDAEVTMYNSAGTLVGKWRDSASKRRISVPTGVVGLAGTIVEEVFSDPIRRQMRMVVYDWAWNMAQVLPDCPKGPKLPEVIAVDTNVDNRLFGAGQKISVRVDAEPGLKCSFDIGDFKKNIPLPQTAQGVYEGFYVVRTGDKSVDDTLMVRMRKANGVDRLWPESGSLITLDGELPPVLKEIKSQTGRDGVVLKWEVPNADDLDEFVIEKGSDPVGDFEIVASTRKPEFVDSDVMQGTTVFYRVRIKDKAGNLSPLDGITRVVMPQFDERDLFGELSGVLVKGNYRISFPVTVPEGAEFSVQSGTKIRFDGKGRIDVLGVMDALGELSSPVRFASNSTEGIKVMPGGKAVLSQCELTGFSKALTAAGGYVEARSSSFNGGEYAVAVMETGNYDFKGLRISNARTGMLLNAGNGTVLRSSITNCTQGIIFNDGNVVIENNNIYDNKVNLKTAGKLVVSDNYLGSAAADNLKIEGDVLVKSILDAPYPHGRRIILVDDKDITPEDLQKKFAKLKERGVSSFHAQHYGDAYQALNKAVKMKDDRDVYLYLSYTLLALSDDIALAEILDEGISKFPYDVRLHQLYVRYLLNKGDLKQARQVLDKALLLSPADSNLLYMKDYLDHLDIPADEHDAESPPVQKEKEEVKSAEDVSVNESLGEVKPEENKDEK
ncbi:right-handed parallel beta-helix repeat-containing protein [Maridesulfovibrio sp.]|uniref:right-handed parallel beta-helix repeat-containing protein n=1 Tax=Maridesulfovibrio sp. TaxID=2795000 RepID=UPI0029CA54B7|nr:right-handed parallel beta-helix repeat-containing protein [Maridesulfovibrio sp.]